MLKRTETKQRSDDRTTNLSRLIIIGNLRIDLFSVATVRGKNVWWGNQGILGVGNRHDNNDQMYSTESATKTIFFFNMGATRDNHCLTIWRNPEIRRGNESN